MTGVKRTPALDRRAELADREAARVRALVDVDLAMAQRTKGNVLMPTPIPDPAQVAWTLKLDHAKALMSSTLVNTPTGPAWRLPGNVMAFDHLASFFRNAGMLEVRGPFLTAHGNAVRKAVIGQRDL